MATESNYVELIRGDSLSLVVSVTDMNDSELDLTGMTVIFTGKKSKTDTDASAVIQASGYITNATGGILQVDLTPSQTSGINPGTYHYDIQLYNSSNGWVGTAAIDRFTVIEDVTKSITLT